MTKKKYSGKGFLNRILNFKISVFFSNIIFQGIRYMSCGEKIYKISITLLFSIPFYFITHNIYSSLIVGHLINYIMNGQFYVVFRYLSSRRTMSYLDLDQFIRLINKYIKIFNPKDILIIGSFTTGGTESTICSIKAYFMATLLRVSGLYMKFPIDIFCFSDLHFLEKISKDEIPVNFLNNASFLEKYPTSQNYKSILKKLIIK